MPIYEYRCRNCNMAFELLVRDSSVTACPHCGSLSLDKLLSVPFVSSGQTSRQSGHTCCGRGERCAAPPCSEGGKCRRG
ncbi:MAG: zinc ribbon domain-containing protein [Anaerolineae bacterium]|nr:zinc ribbon domain-containing protein [Anaerolineae bacterium]